MERQKEIRTRIPVPERTILDLDDKLLELVARKLTSTADLAAVRLTHRRLEAAVVVRITRLDRMTDSVYDIQRLALKFPHLTHYEAPWHSKQLPWRDLFAGLCSLQKLNNLVCDEWEDRQVWSNLVKLPCVRKLELDSYGADAARLRPLSRLTQLTSLSLSSDFEGSDAMYCLNSLIHLKELDVVWTSCQGDPLPAFPTSLTKLQLLIDYVPEDDCFGAGLTCLAHLQELHLSSIDRDKNIVGSCLSALSRLVQLSSLTLESTYDWRHGALSVLEDCSMLHSLNLLSSVTAKALSDLSHIPRLKALHVAGVKSPDLHDLSRLSTLTSLCMGRTTGGEIFQVCLTQVSNMDFIWAMPGLQKFGMYNCKQVSSSAMHSLRHMSHLARLELPSCEGVSPDFLTQLKAMTCLTCLDLSRNLWVQIEHASVLTSLLALVELSLSGCSKLSEGVLQYLQGMTNIKKLSLSGTDWLGRVGLRSGLTDLGFLEVLQLNDCRDMTEVDLLYACNQLRLLQLDVRCLDLSNAGRLRLQGSLGVCKVQQW